ncbi:hypothetical protein SAMN05444365_101931 [Micromonospora pattaloongensis]|uniref:PAS domain-containing protein n=1 Tax=Micromonospora pattaloongensis TaxID=405436 RepID=A0A1H3HPB9_9ACTN|nr:hypothetical protein [Micromonospora pattaloongensis]SDY17351.1 hypothetical protein SAMN05444365_101931 [Micromonospora pattaloongensis]
MAHVELSLSEAFVPRAAESPPSATGIDQWCTTVATAVEPCLVIDVEMRICAASASCCSLLGIGARPESVGRPLLGVLRLLDFTAARGELTEGEIDKIPPLLALTSGRLARGLLRVQSGPAGEGDATVDAIATPLWEDGVVAGSLTFFSEV